MFNRKNRGVLFPIDTRMRIFGNDNWLHFRNRELWLKQIVKYDAICHHLKSQTSFFIPNADIPIFLGICGLLTSFVLDGELNRIEGFAILLVYILTLFIIYQYSLKEIKENINSEEVDVDTSTISVVKTVSNTPTPTPTTSVTVTPTATVTP